MEGAGALGLTDSFGGGLDETLGFGGALGGDALLARPSAASGRSVPPRPSLASLADLPPSRKSSRAARIFGGSRSDHGGPEGGALGGAAALDKGGLEEVGALGDAAALEGGGLEGRAIGALGGGAYFGAEGVGGAGGSC